MTSGEGAGGLNEERSTKHSWWVTFYQLAHSDTRWAKDQAWRTIGIAFALFSAILALYKYPFRDAAVGAFQLIALLVAILAAAHICLLHHFAKESRGITDAIREELGEPIMKVLPARGSDPNHLLYLILHLGVVAVGTAITIRGLEWIHLTG